MADSNTKITIEKIHNEILEILTDIDEFCTENNITYFLSGGTLLGAVRHKGFIPWDDDGDIMLCREEYDRFFKLFPEKYKEKYGVGDLATDPEWLLPYGIVWSRKTTLKSTNLNGNVVGIGVDVFPIDGFSSNRIIRKLFFGRIRILNAMRNACLRETFLETEDKLLLKRILAFFVKPIGARRFAEKMVLVAKKRKIGDCEKAGATAAVHYGERETMDAGYVASAIRVPFEDREFPIPVGYDHYLSNLYGDYMTIPKDAQEKGVTHLDHWNVEFNDEAEPKEESFDE